MRARMCPSDNAIIGTSGATENVPTDVSKKKQNCHLIKPNLKYLRFPDLSSANAKKKKEKPKAQQREKNILRMSNV